MVGVQKRRHSVTSVGESSRHFHLRFGSMQGDDVEVEFTNAVIVAPPA